MPTQKISPHDLPYLYVCHRVRGIGSETLNTLAHKYSSFEEVWHATEETLDTNGLTRTQIAALLADRDKHNPKKLYQKNILDQDITLIVRGSTHYPTQLNDLDTPPFILYARGDHTLLSEPSIAIVGSRKISTYGTQCTSRLATDLATHGLHVVSGLALGIDACAHQSIIGDTFPGKPIAVLGGGIDNLSIAPRSHISLARQILDHGGILISEYVPGTPPNRGTFPARNKIMAALSIGTLVIEAAHDSGTLITAADAHTLGRHLFAIPGSIFAQQSVGANHLIARGHATLVQDIRTITSACNIHNPEEVSREVPKMDPAMQEIYTALIQNSDGLTIDQIIQKSIQDKSSISGTLVMMEIDGIIKKTRGGIYMKI